MKKAELWKWICENEPDLASMLKEMKAAGLNPGMPVMNPTPTGGEIFIKFANKGDRRESIYHKK